MTPADELRRALVVAERKVVRTSERRRALPPGSSRARVTTANAKWTIACEARDRILRQLEDIERQAAEQREQL